MKRKLFYDMATGLQERFGEALNNMVMWAKDSRFVRYTYAYDMRECETAQELNISEIAWLDGRWRAVDKDGYFSDFANVDLFKQGTMLDWIEMKNTGKCGDDRL